MQIKDQVEWCLENDPETRNSDVRLMNLLWIKFYSHYLIRDGSAFMVKLTALYELPNQETVGRWRRKVQEEGRFVPTRWEVAKARQFKEEEWRTLLGYNNPSRG